MIELERKVFGDVAAKEIIGEIPPAKPDIENKLDYEFSRLLKDLEGKSQPELREILEIQKEIEKKMNSRPGAMALSQDKIQLFTDYSKKYIQAIEKKLE